MLGGGQHSQGHALLAAAAGMLKQAAVALNAAVMVTNHVVGGGGGGAAGDSWSVEKRAALGESFQNQAHVRVQLAMPAYEGGAHTATVRSSTGAAPGSCAHFWLTAAGPAGAPQPAPPSAIA